MKNLLASQRAFSLAALALSLAQSCLAAVPLSGVAAIEAGGDSSCAILDSGRVKCWGDNSSGQLGDGTLVDRSAAGDLWNVDNVVDLAQGAGHACALSSSGAVRCWGDNRLGQLGDGTLDSRSQRGDVTGLQSGVVAITAGNFHTCALTSVGGVKCWGTVFLYGGAQRAPPSTTPGTVLTGGAIAIAAGNSHTCALMVSGGVKCWGDNHWGQLGGGTSGPVAGIVDVVGLPRRVTAISHRGFAHTCALIAGDEVRCWGSNSDGQLGDGTFVDRPAPVTVTGLAGTVAIAAGFSHTCALGAAGGVKCWGANADGQLGIPESSARSTLPVDVAGVTSGVTDIALGFSHSCALTEAGTEICWGLNQSGQLGNAMPPPQPSSDTPVLVRAADAARLSNISTRGQVLTGNDVMIGGFVIGGSANKTVAIVATGPSLGAFGIANPLANPTMTLVRSSDQSVVATNDDWQSAANSAQLQAAGFAPSNPLESAILINLAPGAYTAILSGVGNGTGVGLVAVYEVDHPEVPLINISTRGKVLTGNDVMIGGFIIQGSSPQTVAIVATGPSLAPFGITNPLADPTLTLVRSSDQSIIATNDNWQTASNAAQLQGSGFAPSNTLEAAILVTLEPGAYTAIVSGAGGGTGVAVVAVYTTR